MTNIINLNLEERLESAEYIKDDLNVERELPTEVLELFKANCGERFDDEEELEEFATETFFNEYSQNTELVHENIYKHNFKYYYEASFKSEFTIDEIPNTKFICEFIQNDKRIDEWKSAPYYEEILEKVEEFKENQED